MIDTDTGCELEEDKQLVNNINSIQSTSKNQVTRKYTVCSETVQVIQK